MCTVFSYLVYFTFIFFAAGEVFASGPPPKYVWPLGNSSVYREVLEGRDAHLPETNQCFHFSEGYPEFPYTALTLAEEDNTYVDFYLNGREKFLDLAVSMYVYPTGPPAGTILNFLCETGNILKLAVLQGLLFVSFWDEYGVSVGATALPDLLVADTWNHLVVSRQFDTGRIQVYHNGNLVDDIDDDFPNKIGLPTRGSMRLGSSQRDREDVKFKGRFSCFQFYKNIPTMEDVRASKKYCLPSKWNIIPEVVLESRMVDGKEKQCVTNYVAPKETDIVPKDCDVVDMGCLSSGTNWNSILHKHQWTASSRDTANFHLIKRDHVPIHKEDSVLAKVITVNKMVCSRLCLRVHGCKAFSCKSQTNSTSCVMYKDILAASQYETGMMYFSLT